jgi:hypothetical protein
MGSASTPRSAQDSFEKSGRSRPVKAVNQRPREFFNRLGRYRYCGGVAQPPPGCLTTHGSAAMALHPRRLPCRRSLPRSARRPLGPRGAPATGCRDNTDSDCRDRRGGPRGRPTGYGRPQSRQSRRSPRRGIQPDSTGAPPRVRRCCRPGIRTDRWRGCTPATGRRGRRSAPVCTGRDSRSRAHPPGPSGSSFRRGRADTPASR